MSHNNMSTFFSGTDTSTLQEEGSYKNNFVSLIVNNAGSYTAAITRHVFSEVTNNTTYTYEMFGDGVKTGQEEGTEKKECIEYFMMEVHKPELPENKLDTRIDEVLEKKRAASVKYTGTYYPYNSVYNDRTSYDTAYGDAAFYQGKQDTDKRYKPIEIPWKEQEFSSLSNTADINKRSLNITMARLFTGSVTCNVDKVDIDSWISNYDKVYDRMFSSIIDYSEWLAPYLEYLMYHIPNVSTDVIDDVVTAVYANEIIKKIGEPKGRFSKELVDQLQFYGSL